MLSATYDEKTGKILIAIDAQMKDRARPEGRKLFRVGNTSGFETVLVDGEPLKVNLFVGSDHATAPRLAKATKKAS